VALGEAPDPPCPPVACPAVDGEPVGFADGDEPPALHPQTIAPTTSTTIVMAT
jgi:hypothetical protein